MTQLLCAERAARRAKFISFFAFAVPAFFNDIYRGKAERGAAFVYFIGSLS